MDVWNKYQGSKVFLRTKKDRVYSGIVQEVADLGDDIIFISIIDKDGRWVTITAKEIIEIKEER